MTGLEQTAIVRGVEYAMSEHRTKEVPVDYQVPDTSGRVVSLLVGRARTLSATQR